MTDSQIPPGRAKPPLRTIDVRPGQGEMIKAGEMIDIRGVENLTVADRRRWNLLIANAHGPEMAEDGHEWTIPIRHLRGSHKGNERVSETIHRLMTTVVEGRLADGRKRRFQLLGGNDMDDEDRPDGLLTYSFDHRLVELMRESRTFGKLQIAVISAFRSKYALALYEYGSKRVRLKHRRFEELSLDELRDQLGIAEGSLKSWKHMNARALQPALLEVNGLAEFRMAVAPVKKGGRAVTHVRICWYLKTFAEQQAALEELSRPALGRKARLQAQPS